MENLDKKIEVAVLSAAGFPSRVVGAEVGVSKDTVCKWRKNSEIRELIDSVRGELIESSLPVAVGNIKYLVESYLGNDCESKKSQFEKNHGFTATLKLAEAGSVLPSNIQSVFIQNIYNDNRAELSPTLSKLLDSFGDMAEPEVVDAEIC